MGYLGGKMKIAKEVSDFINLHMDGRAYIEPFVGSGAILCNVKSPRRFAGDAHPDLIAFWKALQSGWEPPDSISEEEYEKLRYAPTSALRGFAGFFCSYGGMWFSSYARNQKRLFGDRSNDGGRSFCLPTKRRYLKVVEGIKDVKFYCQDYKNWNPVNCLVYCDPPYVATAGYTHSVDHHDFWDLMEKWSEKNIVLVSEYLAPPGFSTVLEITTTTSMKGRGGKCESRIEKVFASDNHREWLKK